MSNVNFDTFYLTGDVIVQSFEMATSINDDFEWIKADKNNQVVGRHFNGTRWTLDRKSLLKLDDPDTVISFDSIMEHLINLTPEDHLTKVVEMYELMNALPVPIDRAQRK